MRSMRRISSIDMDYEPGGNHAQRSKAYAKRVANNKIRTAGHAQERKAMTHEDI